MAGSIQVAVSLQKTNFRYSKADRKYQLSGRRGRISKHPPSHDPPLTDLSPPNKVNDTEGIDSVSPVLHSPLPLGHWTVLVASTHPHTGASLIAKEKFLVVPRFVVFRLKASDQ